jgi:hypothetical protein
MFLEPLARDRLEGIQGGIERHKFFLLARGAGIDAICDQPAHLVAPIARLLQSDVRVHAERDALLLAREAILETPPATPPIGCREPALPAINPKRAKGPGAEHSLGLY